MSMNIELSLFLIENMTNLKIKYPTSFENKSTFNDIQTHCLSKDYRTRAIITRGLYIFYPLFEVQKRFFKGLFS